MKQNLIPDQAAIDRTRAHASAPVKSARTFTLLSGREITGTVTDQYDRFLTVQTSSDPGSVPRLAVVAYADIVDIEPAPGATR